MCDVSEALAASIPKPREDELEKGLQHIHITEVRKCREDVLMTYLYTNKH
jgi:hypothetical protein